MTFWPTIRTPFLTVRYQITQSIRNIELKVYITKMILKTQHTFPHDIYFFEETMN